MYLDGANRGIEASRSEPVNDGALNVVGATAASIGLAKQAQVDEAARRPSVYDNLDVLARTLWVDVNKKDGGAHLVEHRLRELISTAQYEQRVDMRGETSRIVGDYVMTTERKIVCSFLAAAEKQMRAEGGLPSAMVISGYTIARIVDLLNRLGYSGEGYRETAKQG